MMKALKALGISDAPDEYQLRRSEGLREQLLWDVRARYLLLVSQKAGDVSGVRRDLERIVARLQSMEAEE